MQWLNSLLGNIITPFKWWVVIAPWEMGLLVRLGKKAKVLKPGIHFKIPFLDRIFAQSVRLRTLVSCNINTTSKDGKNVIISMAVDFAISNIEMLYDSLTTPETTFGTYASKFIVNYIKNINHDELSIEDLERKAIKYLLEKTKSFGIGSISVKIVGLAICRTYRIINNDYGTTAALGYIDEDRSGEKK